MPPCLAAALEIGPLAWASNTGKVSTSISKTGLLLITHFRLFGADTAMVIPNLATGSVKGARDIKGGTNVVDSAHCLTVGVGGNSFWGSDYFPVLTERAGGR